MLSTSPNGGDDYKKKKKENKRRERLIWNACYISPPCHQGNKEMKTRPFFYITHIFIFYSVFSKEDEKKMSIGKYYSRSDKKNKKKKSDNCCAHTTVDTRQF